MIGPPSRDELLNTIAALQRVEVELRAELATKKRLNCDAAELLLRYSTLAGQLREKLAKAEQTIYELQHEESHP